MGKLIANLVGRNEANNYLVPVLERLQNQVDEIVFTDDASDDNTVEIVSNYTSHINKRSEPLFSTHEGQLRQLSWEFLVNETKPTTDDWVLAIDCDELLYEVGLSARDLIQNEHFDVINISFFHMWNANQFRIDKAWRPHGSTRLFRFQENGQFKQSALACGSEPTYVNFNIRNFPRRFLQQSHLKMKHLSYIKDEDKKSKFDRYSEIDGGKFHANAHILSIMDESVVLEDWIW